MKTIHKITQTGRSILEMLGVLAIVGILSVLAVYGIRYSLDKAKANDVLSDVSMAYMVLHERQQIVTQIMPVFFDQKTNYEFSGQDIIASSEITSIVSVKTINKGVCHRLMDMNGAENLRIYERKDETSYQLFTECANENEMFFAYADEDETLTCGKVCADNEHCTLDDECKCNENFVQVNDTCMYCPKVNPVEVTYRECCENLGYEWHIFNCSCPAGTYYNGTECTAATGFCIYQYTEPSSPYFTKKYYSDCACNYTEPTLQKHYFATCAYEYTEPGIVREDTSMACGDGQYCALKWTDAECSGTIGAAGQSKIWGMCVSLTSAPPSACRVYDIAYETVPVITEDTSMACPAGQYCALKWTDAECSGTIGAAGQGKIWGMCVSLTSAPPSACRTYITNENVPTITPVKECDEADNYCLLRWLDEKCTNLTANGGNYLYGRCVKMNAATPNTCPVQ